MPWTEYIDVPEANTSRNGDTSRIRMFKVWGASIDQILTDPASVRNGDDNNPQSLPRVGSHYGDPAFALKLERYTCAQHGSEIVALAHYENVSQDTPKHVAFRPQFVQIPYCYKIRFMLGNLAAGGGGAYRWEITYRPFPVEMLEYTITSWHWRSQIDSAIDNALNQVNKLHAVKIGNTARLMLFRGGDVVSTGRRTVQMRYTWLYDPGTKFLGFVSKVDGWDLFPSTKFKPYWDPEDNPANTPQYVRPPFHDLIAVPAVQFLQPDADEAAHPKEPRFYVTCPYQLEAEGYASLSINDDRIVLPPV